MSQTEQWLGIRRVTESSSQAAVAKYPPPSQWHHAGTTRWQEGGAENVRLWGELTSGAGPLQDSKS
eukprot:m.423445 g.423445  ORF g.423445 m.423445 type:complete len:66 (-) comp41343_c0_seq1:101-298(-)